MKKITPASDTTLFGNIHQYICHIFNYKYDWLINLRKSPIWIKWWGSDAALAKLIALISKRKSPCMIAWNMFLWNSAVVYKWIAAFEANQRQDHLKYHAFIYK